TISSVATSENMQKQVIGIGLMALPIVTLWFLGRRRLYQLTVPIYLGSLFLLCLVSVVGVKVDGNRNWFALPGFQFQPLEFGKIALILMLARYMRDPFKSLRDYIPVAAIALPMVGITFFGTGDTGGVMVLVAITVGMMVVRGVPWRHFVFAAVLLGVGVPTVVVPRLSNFHKERLTMFLNPEADPRGKGYQYIQSRIAIGSGGISGKGYRQGTQSQGGFVPADHTDFIFAPWAEEQGFVGAVLLILTFVALFWRIAVLGGECLQYTDKLVIGGTLALLGFQVLENIGAAIGVAPLTGLTLPLVSYGPSSLVATASVLSIVYIVHRDRFEDF
ncbi:MAG: FtsW/RodA/SpoVE family cell cycle protein, partial [Deinococcales bacterium]